MSTDEILKKRRFYEVFDRFVYKVDSEGIAYALTNYSNEILQFDRDELDLDDRELQDALLQARTALEIAEKHYEATVKKYEIEES